MDKPKLLDPHHPLMERFKSLAPASAKHCSNVAQMCEAVANELTKLDKDLLYTAAMFHDVGKLMCPHYYSENQGTENPHDELPPRISYELISAHVGQSAALMSQHKFPNEIIDIVLQHHGNSIIKAFAIKAKTENDENYRYKWDAPTSTEAAVLMIADVCEAKAKALAQQNKLEDPVALVDGVISELDADDQIDILRRGDEKIIRKILIQEIQTIHHKRVSYPDDEMDNDQ